MRFVVTVLLLGTLAGAWAADLRDIEMRRLFKPTQPEVSQETKGRIYIYDGLHDKDIERAMDEQFDRVQSMMFIREKKTDDEGRVKKDPATGADVVEDDGC
jgi:hypothetical protein